MENGDHARLEHLERELERLRAWRHDKISSALQELSLDVDRLLIDMAALKKAQLETGGLLSHWRDGLIILLGAGLLYMLLQFGLPVKR